MPRCNRGTNRRVLMDLTIAEWEQNRIDAVKATASRRATHVMPKPIVQVPPPVSEMRPGRHTPEAAKRKYIAHRDRCVVCTDLAPHCPTGRELARIHTSLLRAEPALRRGGEILEEFRREVEARRARQVPRQRAAAWPRAARAAEKVDKQRSRVPRGDTPTTWDVPTESFRIPLAVRLHLGPDSGPLADESRWRHHPRGNASMLLPDGLRLVWHADTETFTAQANNTNTEIRITADNVGLVLAALANEHS
ncbi:hypothetical protein ACFZBU_39655 [Embleya sp. NPDC008237]|uniref:hypothetical protein n=1 Tax=Embleya sp. NPDC008237 TaxID=3363978 RepID=UPI0036F0B9FA